jgi:seryl-tRNA synthetase
MQNIATENDNTIKNRLDHILDDLIHPLVINITELIRKYTELQNQFKTQSTEIAKINEENTRVSRELIEQIALKTTSEEKARILTEEMKDITTRQQELERRRNATIDEMNKTAVKIMGDLNNISESIKDPDSSFGGKMKRKKILETRKKNKKTRAKKRTLRRFKR